MGSYAYRDSGHSPSSRIVHGGFGGRSPGQKARGRARYFQTVAANPGKVVADLLVTRFVQDACCSVIERKAIDKLIAEQNFSNSDRTDPLSAAKLGKVLGVDAMIVGSITRYDRDDKTSGGGPGVVIGGFGSRTPKTKHDIKGVVQISARIISPDTGEVLAVAQGAGEATASTSPGL